MQSLPISPAGKSIAALDDAKRADLHVVMHRMLPSAADGSVSYSSRALTFKARKPGGLPMLNAYHAESWHELYVTMGGALAALTGLLFVATSPHVEKVAQTPHWARRAFTNTFALIVALIESLLVLVPQPAEWLG